MNRLLIILVFSFSCYGFLDAQLLKLPFSGKYLSTDQFGHFYSVSDIEIRKFDKGGKLLNTYSNNVLGVIASVDITNPYKILVYFRDFTKVLVLDNFLSPTSEVIDLTTINLDETSLVCTSYNNSAWYYNPVKFELIRKDQSLRTTNSSGNIANLLNKELQPNFLIEYNNKVYLNDSISGVLVFDIYGTYLKTIPLYGLTEFQVKDKFIIYANKLGTIENYDFLSLDIVKYKPETYNNVRSVRVEGDLIYIVEKNDQLFIDKIEY